MDWRLQNILVPLLLQGEQQLSFLKVLGAQVFGGTYKLALVLLPDEVR